MRTVIITILAITLLMIWHLWRDSKSGPVNTADHKTTSTAESTSSPETPNKKKEELAQKPPEPSPLVEELHHPETSIKRDLEILHQLFEDYRLIAKTGNPSGNNLEITSALTGNNRYGLSPIPRNHPAVSSKGELHDRLGTPYFFHNLSAQHLEIQSAGPDQKHHTEDDILLSSLSSD